MSVSTPNVKSIMRRSHTKSKSGCQTCRSRRIKCDEVRPRCLKCTQSGRECSYPPPPGALDDFDGGEEGESSSWPAEVDKSCQEWRASGQPPFPAIRLASSPRWHRFSLKDMRYMHYLATVASLLEVGNARKLSLWWEEFHIFVKVAVDYDFLAYAMMGQAAGRLAITSKSAQAHRDASTYRYLAVKGLNKALASFSKEVSEPVICTSHVLSSQEPNWRAWKSIVEGISAVVRSSKPWIQQSSLAPYIDTSQPGTTLTDVPSANQGMETRCDESMLTLLEQGIGSLNQLASCPQEGPELSSLIRQLRDVLRIVHDPAFSWSRSDQYRITHPITAWMNRYDLSYKAISERRTIMLAALAHFFAVAILLDLVFSAMDHPMLSIIRQRGIAEIDSILKERPAMFCDSCKVSHQYQHLMSFPLSITKAYRQRYSN